MYICEYTILHYIILCYIILCTPSSVHGDSVHTLHRSEWFFSLALGRKSRVSAHCADLEVPAVTALLWLTLHDDRRGAGCMLALSMRFPV